MLFGDMLLRRSGQEDRSDLGVLWGIGGKVERGTYIVWVLLQKSCAAGIAFCGCYIALGASEVIGDLSKSVLCCCVSSASHFFADNPVYPLY